LQGRPAFKQMTV